jgi:hypothetical protein
MNYQMLHKKLMMSTIKIRMKYIGRLLNVTQSSRNMRARDLMKLFLFNNYSVD